jgi:hypothetical protein
MAEDGLNSAVCSSCGYIYPNPKLLGSQSSDERTPCPVCKSKAVTFQVQLADTVTLHDTLGLKFKQPGEKKPVVEIKTGDDLHRKSGRWMKLDRRIDRKGNRYTEKVVDPKTGEVTHHCDEPLTDHRGHGSAKPDP